MEKLLEFKWTVSNGRETAAVLCAECIRTTEENNGILKQKEAIR